MKLVKTITEDKLHLTGLLSESTASSNEKTIIIHIHGMGGDPYTSDWYPYFHDLYPKAGFSYLSGQLRGTGLVTDFVKGGEYEDIGNTYEIFEDSRFDIEAWVQFALNNGYGKIILEAHSLGASKAIYYLSQYTHSEISACVLLSPVDTVWFAQSDKQVYELLREEAGSYVKQKDPKHLLSQYLCEYMLSAQTFLSLFTEMSASDVFCYTDRLHEWTMVENIQTPIFCAIETKEGNFADVNITHNILESKFSNAPLFRAIRYEGAGHSFAGYEKQLISDVIAFLKDANIPS